MGVEETDECREPEPRTKLGSRRPGIVKAPVLIVVDAVCRWSSEMSATRDSEADIDLAWLTFRKQCGAGRVVK
jgi:hypothetical protein